MPTKLYVRKSDPFTKRLDFFYIVIDVNEKAKVGQMLSLKDVDLDREIIDPTFQLRIEDAQNLMDNLWHVGLRPSEGSGSAGSLMATQKHLEDMRAIVFKKENHI